MLNKPVFCIILAAALYLGTYRGYVSLFQKGAAEPCQVFPCKIETLSKADQTLLENRIHIRDQKHLEELLEDYLS